MLLRRVRQMICGKLLVASKLGLLVAARLSWTLWGRWRSFPNGPSSKIRIGSWPPIQFYSGSDSWFAGDSSMLCVVAPSSTWQLNGLLLQPHRVAVFGTLGPGGGWLESWQITTCVPFLHIEIGHFQGLKRRDWLLEVVPLTPIPSIHPPSGLPALHLQGESLINPAVEIIKA